MQGVDICHRGSAIRRLSVTEGRARGLLKCFLLLRTVVPAVCNMGERVLPTVRMLGEAAKRKRKEGVIEPTTPRNKDARAQGHDEGSKAGGGGVQLTQSAGTAH